MAWEDVPAKATAYNTEPYSYAQEGETATQRLIREFTNGQGTTLDDVPVERRGEFEEQLDYRLGACENVDRARAWKPKPGVWP